MKVSVETILQQVKESIAKLVTRYNPTSRSGKEYAIISHHLISMIREQIQQDIDCKFCLAPFTEDVIICIDQQFIPKEEDGKVTYSIGRASFKCEHCRNVQELEFVVFDEQLSFSHPRITHHITLKGELQ